MRPATYEEARVWPKSGQTHRNIRITGATTKRTWGKTPKQNVLLPSPDHAPHVQLIWADPLATLAIILPFCGDMAWALNNALLTSEGAQVWKAWILSSDVRKFSYLQSSWRGATAWKALARMPRNRLWSKWSETWRCKQLMVDPRGST